MKYDIIWEVSSRKVLFNFPINDKCWNMILVIRIIIMSG